jgi:hypothetical protein
MGAVQHGMASQGIYTTQLSADKIMASVLWDSEGVIHIAIPSHGVTINA